MEQNITALWEKPRTGQQLREWLAQRDEDPTVLDPGLPIIDAHHHLMDRPGKRYTATDYLNDAKTGHNIVGTVFVECTQSYWSDGPEAMKPVGEIAWARSVQEMHAQESTGRYGLCAAIVGMADLRLGGVERVLEAQIEAGGGRFRGIRNRAQLEPAAGVWQQRPGIEGMVLQAAFRQGFAKLAPLGLSYDALQFYIQLPELVDLAETFPDTTIIANHFGGVFATGSYEGSLDECFLTWRNRVRQLARCPNVIMKLGGLGKIRTGFDYFLDDLPPSTDLLVRKWRPTSKRASRLLVTIDACLKATFRSTILPAPFAPCGTF
jgi:L-fuconolactonase